MIEFSFTQLLQLCEPEEAEDFYHAYLDKKTQHIAFYYSNNKWGVSLIGTEHELKNLEELDKKGYWPVFYVNCIHAEKTWNFSSDQAYQVIHQWSQKLSQREIELKAKEERAISSAASEIAMLKNKLHKTEQEAEAKLKVYLEKENESKEGQTRIAEIEEKLEEQLKSLRIKEASIDLKLDAAESDKEAYAAQLRSIENWNIILKQKQEEVERLNKLINERSKELEENLLNSQKKEIELLQRDKALKVQENDFTERDKKLKATESRLESTIEKLNKKEAHINETEKQIEELNASCAQMAIELEGQSKEINRQKKELNSRQKMIEEREEFVNESEAALDKLAIKLNEQEERIQVKKGR